MNFGIWGILVFKFRGMRASVWSDIFTNNMGKEMAWKWEVYLPH